MNQSFVFDKMLPGSSNDVTAKISRETGGLC